MLPLDSSRACNLAITSLKRSMHNLHWSPLTFRIKYKLCLMMYAAVNGRCPTYISTSTRLVTGSRKYDHITPVLRSLHWLPIHQRIDFKIATLVYKCLHGLAPPYLADDCVLVSSLSNRRQLRSASSQRLLVPRTQTVTYGPRAFQVSGPTVWNRLPANLHDPDISIDIFRRRLKTYLFTV